MNEREHERWRDELATYLLGALEPGEAADLERHLAGCSECRTELDWLRPAIQTLPESVERVEPPLALRTRILDEVRVEVGADAPTVRTRGFHNPLSGSRGRATRRSRPFGFRPIAGFAAAALLLAALGGYAVGVGGGSGSAGPSAFVAGRAPGVTAEVVREGDSGTLHLANVHQLPDGKILEAWIRRGRRIISANSLFAPDLNGRATATIPDMRGVNAVMVTAEPRGGTAQPTSTPIISIAVPQ